MKPELKFHSYIITITTLIVFSIWTRITDLVDKYPVLSVVAAGIITLGSYKAIALVCLAFFRKNRHFKKFILGPTYMEGTWIGFFVGHENQIRYLVETF